MKQLSLCLVLLFLTVCLKISSEPFENKEPREEISVLVPKGAKPALKEEFPQSQLVVDRIKARHRYALSIPFSYAWNTAALTAVSGLERDSDVEYAWYNREVGFALHSQRLRVGSIKNKEYFKKETAGFPENRYWTLPPLGDLDSPSTFTSSPFVHLMLKQARSKYLIYEVRNDRIYGVLNSSFAQNQNITLTAKRNMQDLKVQDGQTSSRVRNSLFVSYKDNRRGSDRINFNFDAVWSDFEDSSLRDLRYLSAIVSVKYRKEMSSGFKADFCSKLLISSLRDETERKNTFNVESRKAIWAQADNVASLTSFLNLILRASAVYDSKYKGFATPGIELALVPKVVQMRIGVQRQAILPEFDDLYWSSKFVKVNDKLKALNFWEYYGSLNIDLITRLKLSLEARYSQPEYRISWEQLDNYVWYPINKETSYAIRGKAQIILNLVGSFSLFAGAEYQKFDVQGFDPEIQANLGMSYGNILVGALILGACLWTFQAQGVSQEPEKLGFAYVRFNRSVRNFLNIFVDGRYSVPRDEIIYYRGFPQAGRIISLGANIIFGGID